MRTMSKPAVQAARGDADSGPGGGPSQDLPDFMPALRQAAGLAAIGTDLGETGDDAEHDPRLCRDDLGIRQTAIRLTLGNTGSTTS